MKKYSVSIRRAVEDWEVPSDIWDSDFYDEDYIEAETTEEAIEIIRNYIVECGANPDDFDYRVEEI